MASHVRIHIPGALYYVIHYRPQGKCPALSPGDLQRVRGLLGAALERHRLRSYGFLLRAEGPDYLRYVVRASQVPASRLVRSIECRRAAALGPFQRSGRRVFVRHRILLVDPRYLPCMVRYLHLLPVCLRLVASPQAYPWSSDRAYRGLEDYDWLNTSAAWLSWPVEASAALRIYRTVPLASVDAEDVRVIENGSELDARVIGGPEFIRSTPALRADPARLSLSELCITVAAAFAVTVDEICSRSHRRILVIARAFLTSYATRHGYTLKRVGQYLHRSEVDLRGTLKRYRRIYPELFEIARIPDDGSLYEQVQNFRHS